MRPRFYFERDGSYNEHPDRPHRKQDDKFRFDWTKPLAAQVRGRVRDYEEFDRIEKAITTLDRAGLLPNNRLAKVQRQADLRADRLMRRFAKATTHNPPTIEPES